MENSMTRVQALSCYPVKSCGGISLPAASVGIAGIPHDRAYLVVGENGMFVAQRSDGNQGIAIPSICRIRTARTDTHLILTAPDMPELTVPLNGGTGQILRGEIWRDHMLVRDTGESASDWFTTYLSRERPGVYHLVRMPPNHLRRASVGDARMSFADGYPFHILSQQSLDDLNGRLEAALPMNRFRPNIVLDGDRPYMEDHIHRMQIGEVTFHNMGPCVRCPTTITNQDTGERGKDPLRTLAGYRRRAGGEKGGVIFGCNFNHEGEGVIAVGDPVKILE
jgi:uncharacterized protein YcbX